MYVWPGLRSRQSGDRFRCARHYALAGRAEELSMHSYLPRASRPDGPSSSLRAHTLRRFAFTSFFLLLFATAASAVVVRGRVTTARGTPVPGARVQLVENGKAIAQATAWADGRFEIR